MQRLFVCLKLAISNKNLAIASNAKKSRVSCAHSTLRASIGILHRDHEI